MSVLQALKSQSKSAGRVEQQRYVQLLKNGKSEDAVELAHLGMRLGLSVESIDSDAQTLKRVSELRAIIGAGSKLGPRTDRAKEALAEHSRETRRIMNHRDEERKPLAEELGQLQVARERAEEAIVELNTLKQQNEMLLKDEAPANPKDLD